MIGHRRVFLAGMLGMTVLGGCSSELETGYKPRLLSASSTDRRAYYAPPFTAEATPSSSDKSAGEGVHKPGEY
jgi:hypothetical protein